MSGNNRNIILLKAVKKLNNAGHRCTLRDAIWIVNRYFHYWSNLVANGFKISTNAENYGSIVKTNLSYEIIRKITKPEKQKFLFSNLLYGYMFKVDLSLTGVECDDYNFYPDKNIKSEIQKVLDSDVVFKLTRK